VRVTDTICYYNVQTMASIITYFHSYMVKKCHFKKNKLAMKYRDSLVVFVTSLWEGQVSSILLSHLKSVVISVVELVIVKSQ
jgi:hypothetical protein